MPGLATLREYQIAWLRPDVVAGIVLAAILVPQGMAYAELAGLPAVTGLYATIAPLLAYALFGPSRILVLGPDSTLAAVILAVVLPLSGGDPERALDVGGTMAIVSGIVCIAAGLSRLGFITELLSKPIRYGYMNGIALVVLTSQLPKLLGFSIESSGPLRDLWLVIQGIVAGKVNWSAAGLGLGVLAIIFAFRRFTRFPGILVAVIFATVLVVLLRLESEAGVKVLGSVPQGLPALTIPWISPGDLVQILVGGFAVAIVAFADTSVLSRTYAARTNMRVDANQEMVGLGAANLAAGFFQGFPISSSSSACSS